MEIKTNDSVFVQKTRMMQHTQSAFADLDIHVLGSSVTLQTAAQHSELLENMPAKTVDVTQLLAKRIVHSAVRFKYLFTRSTIIKLDDYALSRL